MIDPMVTSTNPSGDCHCGLWDEDPEHFREEGIRSAPAGKMAQMIGNPGAVAYDSKREEILVPN